MDLSSGQPINSYIDAVDRLQALGWFAEECKLDNALKLAAYVGNPQNTLRFIHVAGTNGKGSTCAMLESIYRSAGLRVGLFTSPHLVSFRERVQVNRQLICEAKVVEAVKTLHPFIESFPRNDHPTFFEAVTILALQYFAEKKCQLVIWETGFGGRLDATNIVTPLASVITNIGFDHQQWLGDTLEKIAAEKAGIIKPGVPVLTATDELAALAIIEKMARERNSSFTRVETKTASGIIPVSLAGEHQHRNAALAVATVEVLQHKIPVSDEQIRRGLAQVDWPGRLQLITRPHGQRFLFDGAHNVAGAEVLHKAVKTMPEAGATTLILGIFADKDWAAMCEILAPLAARILLVPVASERTAKPEELEPLCRTANPQASITVCNSLSQALTLAERDSFVVIAGSLYLIGEAMELLGLSPVPTADEKALNNWQPVAQPAKTL